MALDPLITAQELRDAMSPQTYLALLDDYMIGDIPTVDASGPVVLLLANAHIHCVSWLGANYNKIPRVTDVDVSQLLKSAELNYAIGMAYDRHPEYVRQYGLDHKRKSAYDRAEITMMRIQEACLKLVDSPSMDEPQNVGGVIVDSGQRVFLGGGLNGGFNSGDF